MPNAEQKNTNISEISPRLSSSKGINMNRWLSIEHSARIRDSFIYVQEVGDYQCSYQYHTTLNNHPTFFIKYVILGGGTLEYDSKTYTISANQVYWIDCRKLHNFHSVPGSHDLWIHFFGGNSEEYYKLFLEMNGGNIVLDVGTSSRIQELINSVISLYYVGINTITNDIIATGHVTNLLVNMICATSLAKNRLNIPKPISEARQYILAYYMEDISLESLSKHFAMSKFHFQKTFKKYYGLTPTQLIINTRISAAKRLLNTSQMSVTKIAEFVGFSGASYFVNVFKKYEGLTPMDYRKSLSENIVDLTKSTD